jgi:hypothetical protein
MWLLFKKLMTTSEKSCPPLNRHRSPYRISHPYETGCLPEGRADRAQGNQAAIESPDLI